MSALIASLFAVGASPAAAVEGQVDAPPPAKACVGEALDDHGFTDLGTLEAAVPNINCLAYYGITKGKTADTFDPNSNVTRSEMALFLYRAADLMGVDLMGGDMMVDYGDIADLGEDRQNAITALARNGILTGRGSMAFEPGADITRAEMAVALVALLDKTPGALVQQNSAGEYLVGADPGKRPDDHFSDSRSSQPRHIDDAISAAYELGITTGAGDGSMFDPSGTIPRRDMATFIIRALNHSNVRPRGLTAQADGGTVTVSVRGADFAPVPNQAIDAFSISAANEARAFKDDGTCQTGRLTAVDGTDRCKIDGEDPATRTNGNVTLAQIGNNDIGDGLTVWVWTGDDGDTYNDNTTDSYVLSVTKGTPSVDPDSAAISTDLPKGASRAHFGSAVTVTIQLQGTAGTETVDVGPGDTEVEYSVFTRYFSGSNIAADATNSFRASTRPVKVGADGSATFTVVTSDPSAQASNTVTARYTVTRSVVLEEDTAPTTLLVPDQGDPDTSAINSSGVTQGTTPETYRFTDTYTGPDIVFSDEDAKVSTVAVEAPNQAAPGPDGSTRITATVTVLDQFGKPFRGAAVVLSSDNTADTALPNSDLSIEARFTGSDGKVGIRYSYSGAASVETLTATWNGDAASATDTGCYDATSNATGLDRCGATTVYWIGQIRDDNSGTTASPALPAGFVDFTGPTFVRDHDAASRQIVVAAAAAAASPPHAINYDSGDYFNVITSVAGSDVETPSRMDEFEAALTKRLAEVAEDSTAAAPQLSWTNYNYDDSAKITVFTLDVTPS